MSDNIIRFLEEELVVLGSFNADKTQVNFNECIFNKKASFSLAQIEEALEICQELSQNNQISLLVQHRDRVSVWVE
ncbi:MAG: hypothetical protein ACFCAD_18280 [Pleurocapsa sp.]